MSQFEIAKIVDYKSGGNPYEKHYNHFYTQFNRDTLTWQFRKGDYHIRMGTDKDRFIVELLEPDAPDSYFNWNFFDAVLQQKEWYSGYVFEDKAAQLLKSDSTLKLKFDKLKKEDADFAKDARAQLTWVYRHSRHYEKEHMLLPVFRIEN